MKQSVLFNWAGAGILALTLTIGSATLPAAAQTNSSNPTTQDFKNNNKPNLDTTPFQETKGKADNYGWLGLFGLLGLLNLLRKPAARTETTTVYREPDETPRSSDRL